MEIFALFGMDREQERRAELENVGKMCDLLEKELRYVLFRSIYTCPGDCNKLHADRSVLTLPPC